MGKITVFGAGICGLSSATILSSPKPDDPNWTPHEITIVARDLPGDEPSQDWASPWACAGWVALGGTDPEKHMQVAALNYLLDLAKQHPESSVRRVKLDAIFPAQTKASGADVVWPCDLVPNWELVSTGCEPGGRVRTRYDTAVVTPKVFLPWLRALLEKRGVVFKRIPTVKSLEELGGLVEYDVLVNASGRASATLEDVQDGKLTLDRTYCTVVKSTFEGASVLYGDGYYSYVFGRGDGTAVVGGLSHDVEDPIWPTEHVHGELFRHVAENGLPEFPSPDPAHYKIVQDLVGIRPLRFSGVKVKKATTEKGQRVVHAYGTTTGGYMYSFGLGQEVAKLVESMLP